MKDKARGDVFTLSIVVDYMLDMVGYMPDKDLSAISIIEPSCGEGAFVVEILRRLKLSSERFLFSFEDALIRNFRFFDTDIEKINKCILNLKAQDIDVPKFIFRHEDFLQAEVACVDIVIGNPPYIRHERIDSELKRMYRERYSTFRFRADLYIPFFEKSLSLLKENGRHCFICSNRWLKSQYGAPLRGLISRKYSLSAILNMEHTNPFDESVIAYPAITFIENNSDIRESIGYCSIDSVSELNNVEFVEIPNIRNRDDWDFIFNPNKQNDSFCLLTDLGFKVGIGVATGADDIFISRDLSSDIETALLLPIITSKDITSDGIAWKGNYLFNPFDENGHIIDLSEYPKAQKYLLSHRERLENRYISKKNPQYWFRTIDKIKSDVLSTPKIVLPDITANKFIQIDEGVFYPHHNLSYITSDSIYKLKILCSILMSDFVYQQLCALSNSMNGGYPRWQSQHINRLRLPNFLEWDSCVKADVVEMYDKKDLRSINELVNNVLS